MRTARIALGALLSISLAGSLADTGCKTATYATPDAGQSATCTFFLPSGDYQPSCVIEAGDLAATGNGHVRVSLTSDAVVSFDKEMDFQILGALVPGSFSFSQLLGQSFGEVAVVGDRSYVVSPSYDGKSWGDALMTLRTVQQLPAQIDDTVLSVVSGEVEMKMSSMPDQTETLNARVSF